MALQLVALYFFVRETTDKSINPWESRALNHECDSSSNYFELHDLWHILVMMCAVCLGFGCGMSVVLIQRCNWGAIGW